MTSPITAEERAERVVNEFYGEHSEIMDHAEDVEALNLELEALIASAIRDAENEALERAAVMIDEGPLDTEKFMRGIVVAAGFEEIAERIRSLKSTKETGHEG